MTDRCAFERKAFPPGQHGQGRRGKVSEYGAQLREKQKVRKTYGLLEKQFRSLFESAARKRGVTAEIFFKDLEMRMDNVVYRMGFARSRNEARQVVRHNHILLNGKRCNIPSAALNVGDEITLAPKSQSKAQFGLAAEFYAKRPALTWFEVDHTKHVGKVSALPTMDDVQMPVKERLIVELYSK
jgi:small subunit ribosomal protein S4